MSKISQAIRHVAIFGNYYQTSNCEYVVRVVEALQRHGVTVEIERKFAEFLLSQKDEFDISLADIPQLDQPSEKVDLVFSMGGDGTFLNTAEKLGDHQLPILGVNTGRLGFLADVMTDDIEHAVAQLAAGEYTISERSVIESLVDDPSFDVYPFALNEVAVLKHDNSSLIKVETLVDGELLTAYVADGLIVSTPTGSTGYALSVGGPVLSPDSATFCLAPVAPHSLAMRPVVLSDNVTLQLKVKSRTGKFLIAVDGRSMSLPEETTIILRKADYKVMVVKMPENDFFSTLRHKMMWGADQR